MWAFKTRGVCINASAISILTKLQIGHIMLDNAENNATTMKELEDLLHKEGIKFDAKDNRISCYLHIINICISHIVSSLVKVGANDLNDKDDESFSDDKPNDEGYNGEEEENIDEEEEDDLEQYKGHWPLTLK